MRFATLLGGLRDFIISNKIVTIPSPVPPILEETPPFMRALTFASMDTPGPYEKVAKEAFFNVTLPEKIWTPERVEELHGAFNRGTILSTAIHEAYPGHYVQFLWMQHVDVESPQAAGREFERRRLGALLRADDARRRLSDGDPKMRLGQLQDALLRDARYIVGIEMHTGKLTFDQGVEFFEKEGYQTARDRERETKRGTSDPTYLYYTLGKLQILKLREDYRKKKGAQFSLEEFHDSFHEAGIPADQDRAQGAAGQRFADALNAYTVTNALRASSESAPRRQARRRRHHSLRLCCRSISTPTACSTAASRHPSPTKPPGTPSKIILATARPIPPRPN